MREIVSADMADAAEEYVPVRRPFTVQEYDRMKKVGILGPDERTELIEGEILVLPPATARQAACVGMLNERFRLTLNDQAVVGMRNSVRLDRYTEPTPDVALLRPPTDRYTKKQPKPADVLLLVEVADTTLRYVRERKLLLYAAAGIPEVWLFDLKGLRVLTYQAPMPDGYEQASAVRAGGALTPALLPGFSFEAADLLRRSRRK